MKRFEIGVSYQGYKMFMIEAETREEAEQIAQDNFDIFEPFEETPPFVTEVEYYGVVK